MKPYTHPCQPRLAADACWLRRISTLLVILPILFLIPLLPVAPTLAQGQGHSGGASTHAFPAESVAPILSPAQLWSKIHKSHVALLRAVPAMSKSDVEYYLKALKADLNTLSDHPGNLNSAARTSLDEATKRVNELARTLKNAVKSKDAASADAQLGQLNFELDRIGRMFPTSVLPTADGLSLVPQSDRATMPAPGGALSVANAVDELKLTPLSPRRSTVESKTVSSQPGSTSDESQEACPMHSGTTDGGCSCCAAETPKTAD